MQTQFSHYEAIQQRKALHLAELEGAEGAKKEHHEHNIRMIDRELEGEIEFLQRAGVDVTPITVTAQEILNQDIALLKELGVEI